MSWNYIRNKNKKHSLKQHPSSKCSNEASSTIQSCVGTCRPELNPVQGSGSFWLRLMQAEAFPLTPGRAFRSVPQIWGVQDRPGLLPVSHQPPDQPPPTLSPPWNTSHINMGRLVHIYATADFSSEWHKSGLLYLVTLFSTCALYCILTLSSLYGCALIYQLSFQMNVCLMPFYYFNNYFVVLSYPRSRILSNFPGLGLLQCSPEGWQQILPYFLEAFITSTTRCGAPLSWLHQSWKVG